MPRERHSARTRFTWGVVLLVVGATALSINLGFRVPRDVWRYWPLVPLTIGAVQLAWPGSLQDRLSSFWLLAIGFYGLVSSFELFGLHWGTSWPILIVALGIRIVLAGLIRGNTPPSNSSQNPPGGNSP